ncbi:MAG: ABC transporter permease [Candidatus Dormibacteria bacterium]
MTDSVAIEPDQAPVLMGEGGPPAKPSRRGFHIDVTDALDRYGILGAWLLIIVLFAILEPTTFFTVANFETVFGSQAVLLILALALLIPLTVGEFDLSVTGAMSVSAVLIGFLNVQHGWPIVPTVLVALASGVIIGLINTFFVMVVGVQSIVVTLGSGTLWMGVAYGIEPSNVAGISPGLVNVTATNIVGLPLAFWYGLILTLLAWYVYSFTPLGRYLHFVGANRQVSRMSGIPVTSIRAGSLMVSAIVSSLSGVVLVGTLASSSPSDSAAFLLPAFAAVFLGATAITPGRFNPWGTFIAVFFLITGITGLELFGLSGWVEDVFYGASLVLAVALSRLAARRRGTE